MTKLFLIALSLALLLCVGTGLSQTDPTIATRRSTWLSVGGGLGTLTTSGGFCWRASFSLQRGRHVLSGRAFGITEFIGDMVEPRSPRPEESETEIALLYGYDLSSKSEYSVFSIGLGYVHSEHRGRIIPEPPLRLMHERVTIGSLGAAIDLQVLLPLGSSVALGLSAAGNINATRSFGGGFVVLAIGSFD